MFRYDYKGYWNSDAHCYLDIKRFPDKVVVIATETGDNEGTSITNMAEHIATQVCRDFDIDPQSLVWIELYDTESYRGANEERDEYDLVTFDWNGRQFSKPKWKHLTRSELYALIGEEV